MISRLAQRTMKGLAFSGDARQDGDTQSQAPTASQAAVAAS
jgi:hypothetical protein